jgi:hypothetical protein
MSDQRTSLEPNKYAQLPPRIRPEDMRTTQDVRQQPPEKGEHDRETEWMLRTAGVFV